MKPASAGAAHGSEFERQAVAQGRIARDQVALLRAQEPWPAAPAAAAVVLAHDRQHGADGAFQSLLEDAREPFPLELVLHLGVVDRNVARQAPLAPQVIPGVLEGLEEIARIELKALGKGRGEALRAFRRGADRLGLDGGQCRIAPDRLAVLAPMATQRPARQLLTRIPFALAEMQQWPLREAVSELAEQHARQPAFLGAERQRVPLRAIHVVDRHEGGLATHGEPEAGLGDIALDRLADAEQPRPLFVAVRLGGARRLPDPAHLHVIGEGDLALLDGAFDRRGARRLGRAGERDVALAGEQARGRIESDPAGARQIDFRPGMKVGEVVGRTLRPVERLLVGHQLDQVTGGEARGEAEMAQDGDQQPAGVAARALGQPERLLAGLHAGFHPHDVADLLLQPRVEADQEIDGARLARAVDFGEPRLEQRTRRLDFAKCGDLLGERGIVAEGKGLAFRLEEEVERIDHRHVGDEIDGDLELRGLLREHQARQVIALRILLPVDEVILGLDLERVGEDRRAAVRGGTQAHDLRSERDRPVVGVGRPMMQRDVDAHDGL